MKPNEKLLQVRLPKELHTLVKLEAARTGRTLADIVRELLTTWLKEQAERRQEVTTQQAQRGNAPDLPATADPDMVLAILAELDRRRRESEDDIHVR